MSRANAVFGPAVDGGWWSIGFGRPCGAFAGVPMSRPDTGQRQRERPKDSDDGVALAPMARHLGRRPAQLPQMRPDGRRRIDARGAGRP
jgi:glycosyltransferase A (GT-A) superfamily protein (DUF2064 family)